MKKQFFYFVAVLLAAAMCNLTSCLPPNPPNDGGTEQKPGDDTGGGGGGGQQTAAADIFKAFDKVGNQFWYQWYLSGSYQSYAPGRIPSSDKVSEGRVTYKSANCRGWEVVAVSGNTATVNVYKNFDFDHPTQMTFTRGSDGSLFMDGRQVTNTQSPEFYLLNFSKNDTYEWHELYNNGEYTNIFYHKSNGYTSVSRAIDISETWNSYGLAGGQESEITNADAGSSTMTLTLKRAQTAYVSKSASKPAGISITNVEYYTIASHQYIKNNPTASGWRVSFTHNSANTWGYAIGMYMNDGNWYPCYRITDIQDYVKSFDDGYDNWGKGGDLLCDPIKDFSATTHDYYFFLTPKAVQLGQSAGALSFCIFALGWGPDLISTIDGSTAAFNITFNESGMPARRISDNRELKPAPLSVKPIPMLR